MIFKNISNFNNSKDYLPILNGSLNVVIVIIFLLYSVPKKIKYFKNFNSWYEKFNLSVAIAVMIILFIVIIIARFFYKYLFNTFSIWKFSALTALIQIIHDIIFYIFFKIMHVQYNYIFDFFNLYTKKMGVYAILVDSFIIIFTSLLSSYFATFSVNINIITLVISLYFLQYMVYY